MVDEHLVNLAREIERDKVREVFEKEIELGDQIGFQ